MRSFLLTVMALLILPAAVLLAEGNPARITFPVANLQEWQQKSFHGETVYQVEKVEGMNVVKAESNGTASGYYRKISIKAAEYPIINWSWKITAPIPVANPSEKAGDDYVARIYVVFPGTFFWQYRALVYVWADKLPVGTVMPSPFTDRVAVVVIESGSRSANLWRHESRNYREDYRAYFHKEPEDPLAVAFMTDSDSTGIHAVAWYGDISFSR